MRGVSVSRPFSEHFARPAFFPDPDPPRLGHFPDPRFDRLEFLLTRLLDSAPFGPELAPFGAPLFGVRAFDVGVAGSGEGVPRRGGSFRRPVEASKVAAVPVRVARPLRCWRASLRRGQYWRRELPPRLRRLLPPPFAAALAPVAGAAAGFVAATCGTGSAGTVETFIDLRRHPAFQLGHRLRRRAG